jgi:hypothetical protein
VLSRSIQWAPSVDINACLIYFSPYYTKCIIISPSHLHLVLASSLLQEIYFLGLSDHKHPQFMFILYNYRTLPHKTSPIVYVCLGFTGGDSSYFTFWVVAPCNLADDNFSSIKWASWSSDTSLFAFEIILYCNTKDHSLKHLLLTFREHDLNLQKLVPDCWNVPHFRRIY